jgi:glycosyltransferase involved in cell wall biosynthesis
VPELPRSVLLLTDRYPPHPGGLSRASQRLARHAAEFAHVHVLVLRDELAPPGVLSSEEGSITVHRLGGLRNAIEAGQAAAQAIDWLHARHPFELLHGQYGSTGGFLAAYHARRLGAAGYVSLRGNDLDRDLYDPTRAAHLIWALQHAHAVGAVSKALARDAEALSARPVRYTPNSVDGEVFASRPRQTARAAMELEAGPVIGFVGELRYKKGAPFILDAFRTLPTELGAQLLLVGVIRAEERKLLELFQTEEPELAGRVHIRSYLDTPEALCDAYAAMDLVLSPSLWEGMPNAVLEAMACERPVLASDAGGIPDLITPGKTGWLISRHELHRLGEALAEVLSLPEAEREAVGATGSIYVREHFPPEREKRELREAYASCLAARAQD